MLLPPAGILAVRGIAGGITSGSTYFGIESGSRLPPGSGIANARPAPKRPIKKLPALVTLSLRKRRRVIMAAPRPPNSSPPSDVTRALLGSLSLPDDRLRERRAQRCRDLRDARLAPVEDLEEADEAVDLAVVARRDGLDAGVAQPRAVGLAF